MILLTGATGTVGKALLPMLLEQGHEVRTLVRDPRRLGKHRVGVRIAIGDLVGIGDARLQRQALRGAETVIHLAGATRDRRDATIEEVNGLGTSRLLRAAEREGIGRFLFFSALDAHEFQRTRFFRSKALAENAVSESPLAATVFAPSIIYDPADPWMTLLRRISLLPLVPISGSGDARYQPIWAGDAARCVMAALDDEGTAASDGARRFELAGPETMSYEEAVRAAVRAFGHDRPLVHVPLGLVRAALQLVRRILGDAAFATWEEAELMEVPMVSERGADDARALGVEPRPLADVLSGSAAH